MHVSMFIVKAMDIGGSAALIVLSLYAVFLMHGIYNKKKGAGLYTYLYAQTIALAIFAVSRSAGHIIKHILVSADLPEVWKAVAPISGSINSITFIIFGLFALLYSNIRLTSERVNALEESRKELKLSQERLQYALKVAEDERAKSEAIVAGIGDGISIQDTDFRILYQNQVHKDLLGSHEGEYCYRAYENNEGVCEGCPLALAMRNGGVYRSERSTVTGSENMMVHITASPLRDSSGQIIGGIEAVRDITESKKLEEQLLHAQKMEAIGQLAGGVAHDFNNLLTAIIGYSTMLSQNLSGDAKNIQYVNQVMGASEKAAELTKSLLAFSRKQEIELRPINLKTVLTSVRSLLSRIIGEDISFHISIPSDDIVILADPGQIEQVLLNLATNARDAMVSGGMLNVDASIVPLGEDSVETHGIERPGSYVMISVSDTGKGMNDEVRSRIFEPFFTTKSVGKGTGLGLSIVYGIVKQHRGAIHVYSEPGVGTTFKIFLPLSYTSETFHKTDIGLKPEGGIETILLAEDSREVRMLMATLLEDAGYSVRTAQNGQEALDIFRKNAESIDLLILDVIMPVLNGKQVFDEVKTIRPDVKVIFTSGYTFDIMDEKGIQDQNLDFIPKPLSPHVFLAKVREVLNKP